MGNRISSKGKHPHVSKLENKDGSIVLETYPAHPEEISHTIMHWIPYLTVLEPESFKDEIKKSVTTYLKSL